MQKTCLDCGKPIWRTSTRCVACCNKNNIGRKYSIETKGKMSRNQIGENNSNYRGGKPKCIVCGKQQTVHHSPRCRACSLKDPIVIEKFRKLLSGDRNPRWKGGITPITHIIRKLPEMQEWKKQVFLNSDYKCVDCGASGYLEAHHIIPFTKLFMDFINTYNQFSVIDDKDTLVRLALNYTPFYDVSNGKAVCRSCHEKYRVEARRDNQSAPESFYPKTQTTLK